MVRHSAGGMGAESSEATWRDHDEVGMQSTVQMPVNKYDLSHATLCDAVLSRP